MQAAAKLAIVLGAIVLFSGRPASAQADKFGVAFQKAEDLAKQSDANLALTEYRRIFDANRDSNPDLAVEAIHRRITMLDKLSRRTEALGEYNTLINDFKTRNKEVAAQAMLDSGLYARDKFGANADEKRHGASQAWKTWKQLRDDAPDTAAGKRLASDNLISSLEAQIRSTNSGDWKYKVIDFLVGITGRNPSFSYALALILIALIVKAITFPLTLKQYASMREMQRIQPLMKELQAKYKGPELNTKVMELYKEHNVNPFAGCFPALVQLPFLYMVFMGIQLYEVALSQASFLWIGSPLHTQYPGFIGGSLSQADVPLLVLYCVSMFITMRMTPSADPMQAQQQKTMAWMMSGFFFYLFLNQRWGSGFVLYWFVQNVLSIWQQYEFIYKPAKAKMAADATGVAVDLPNGGSKTGGQANRNGAPATAPAKPAAGTTPVRVRPRKRK